MSASLDSVLASLSDFTTTFSPLPPSQKGPDLKKSVCILHAHSAEAFKASLFILDSDEFDNAELAIHLMKGLAGGIENYLRATGRTLKQRPVSAPSNLDIRGNCEPEPSPIRDSTKRKISTSIVSKSWIQAKKTEEGNEGEGKREDRRLRR